MIQHTGFPGLTLANSLFHDATWHCINALNTHYKVSAVMVV